MAGLHLPTRGLTLRLAATALTGALMLAGCTGEPEPPSPSQTSSTSSPSAGPDRPSSTAPEPLQTATEDLDGDASHEPLSPPTWDETSRAAANTTAVAAVGAWARPDLDDDAWWANLAPYLSESGRQTFASIDPAFIPATTITGEAVLENEDSPWLATLLVPTDAGDVRVLLVRDGAQAPWLLERIDPA